MRYSKLGSSGIEVSRVCLGSMTWGQQNNQADADQQIDFALSRGVNFIDTAEMYSVPPRAETYGATESIIGNWLSRHQQQRKQVYIASKIAGPGFSYIRGGKPMDGEGVIAAVDASLKRLNTDYIDLYQLHWPNRVSPHFGKHLPNNIRFSKVNAQTESNAMLEILQALQDCVDAGKIRHCGLSDETTWGINQYIRLAEKHALPKMVSIQNEFSLLHSKDWPYLIENCFHEDVAYLPWSPLAGGALSGKYLNGQRPEGSRWTLEQRNGLFRDNPQSQQAIEQYVNIAKKYAITPSQLALAWCDQIDGVTSTIIGATTIEQLSENLDAFDLPLSEEVLAEINSTLQTYPSPF
ncbi:aldo/keto reductase [Aliiglaciecola sp. LCG003]|uniref:aldo/keto reductase n=1 Tax=Aliiglaciecola sp. LCG003 TaxID=3053655 RepID=UPI002573C027|nr:aldo/keto reductase [Aliiglaciecola sp. LCG003]WJG09855.1 aldo/keto reductase [Aliiglaciecola sp. LCG003]